MTVFNAASPRRLQWRGLNVLLAAAVLVAQSAYAPPAQARETGTATPARPVAAKQRTVLVLGDSLSAGFGLEATQGWVPLVAHRVSEQRPGWHVVNASISGETTAGGAARVVSEVVRLRPGVVIIELGANDGLRGLPLRQTRHNLAFMIGAAKGVHARVLLIGMRLPPNYGADYTQGFEAVYRDLAGQFDTAFVPFLLAPIMRDPAAFQADNMHPVARVQPLLMDHVWKTLGPMLD